MTTTVKIETVYGIECIRFLNCIDKNWIGLYMCNCKGIWTSCSQNDKTKLYLLPFSKLTFLLVPWLEYCCRQNNRNIPSTGPFKHFICCLFLLFNKAKTEMNDLKSMWLCNDKDLLLSTTGFCIQFQWCVCSFPICLV